MSVPCTICDEFRGHNQETHNRHYEALIAELLDRVSKLEAEALEIRSRDE